MMTATATTWAHDALASDLASHLAFTGGRVIFENMQLGPAGSPRPDVYTIPKVYSRFTPLAYEVKISVADFRSDVTSGKWQSYRAYGGLTQTKPYRAERNTAMASCAQIDPDICGEDVHFVLNERGEGDYCRV